MLLGRDILKTAQGILTLRDKLHPLLFDNTGTMIDEPRQQLLKISQFYIGKALRTIKNVEVVDIILVGSSSSYFYTETSDFDIKILLDFSKNKAIGSNIKTLLKILNNTYYSTSVKLRLYKRYIDFRFSENDNFVIGNYSLLHNKWNVKPRHDFDVAHIQSAELVRKFYSRTAETYRIFSQLVSENGIFAKSEIQKIANDYTRYFSDDVQARADIDNRLADFLSFKLIRKTHFLRELIDFERQANNDRLSLREEYER